MRQLKRYGIDLKVAKEFALSLEEHITYVREAGNMIGVSQQQLKIHDISKWSDAEFPGYAMHFKGGGAPNEFARAWLHHIHHNPHHWQYWIFSDNFTPKGSSVENGVVEMPLDFIKEMVADWMGAGRAYQGHWDMSEWLSNNIPRITIHSKSLIHLRNILDELGYADIIYTKKFKNE